MPQLLESLREYLLETLSEEAREILRAMESLETRLEGAWSTARDQWSALELREEDFLDHMATHLERATPTSDLSDWLHHFQAEDFYLATACYHGSSQAIEAFESQFSRDLDVIVRRFAKTRHPEDDLRQRLREKLFVHTPGRPAKIGDYSGQGFLQNWLRVTATRTMIDLTRYGAQHKREDLAEPEVLIAVPDAHFDTELEFLKREYRAHFKDAFRQAIEELTSRERNLLRHHMVAGHSIDQIGALFGVHRATAARHVARARESLIHKTRSALAARLDLAPEDYESFMELIESRLELSMSRLLTSRSA